ncbi:D-mannose binding lectin [Caulobacter sp. AP07]|uniref:D-mannose binding lectin n=1 Tax=Caulobacter sp. AP07 TaxID=1144304 RepID=UPI00027225AE|nr:D-mannose binding lectin [Caulobacter sp. AP07]EJL24461.1 D-mannose binding lectin [Caulobacter sp. AP07]
MTTPRLGLTPTLAGIALCVALLSGLAAPAGAQSTSSFYYDSHGQLITTGRSDGLVRNYSYDLASNRTAASSQVLTPHAAPDRLASGEILFQGQWLNSPDGRFGMTLQADGNLVLYRHATGAALWGSNTLSRATVFLAMQSDGNLVLYGPQSQVIWMSGSHGANPNAAMQNDGNFVVTASPNWSTQTCCY